MTCGYIDVKTYSVAYLGWVGNAKACVLEISKKQTPAPFFVYDYFNSKTKFS